MKLVVLPSHILAVSPKQVFRASTLCIQSELIKTNLDKQFAFEESHLHYICENIYNVHGSLPMSAESQTFRQNAATQTDKMHNVRKTMPAMNPVGIMNNKERIESTRLK